MVDQRDAGEVHVGLASPPKKLVFAASLSWCEWIAIALLHQDANRSKRVC